MAKKSKVEEVEEVVVSPEVVEEAPTKKANFAIVFRLRDGSSREYSKEVHGKDFEALAKEFAEKQARIVVDSYKV